MLDILDNHGVLNINCVEMMQRMEHVARITSRTRWKNALRRPGFWRMPLRYVASTCSLVSPGLFCNQALTTQMSLWEPSNPSRSPHRSWRIGRSETTLNKRWQSILPVAEKFAATLPDACCSTLNRARGKCHRQTRRDRNSRRAGGDPERCGEFCGAAKIPQHGPGGPQEGRGCAKGYSPGGLAPPPR